MSYDSVRNPEKYAGPVWPSVGFNEWLREYKRCRYCGKKLTEAEQLDENRVCADCFTE